MLGIGNFLWRLVPANPILLRVVSTSGKRKRDLIIRCVYLGVLVVAVLVSSGNMGSSLSMLNSASIAIFRNMSYLQLALVALIAPVFTAGAITQERDSQTYDILLSTPLTNGQIVLGSLLSRLFFVIALLVSGIPIFSITQIFGGVAISAITTSFLIAAGTAFITGALAMAIATTKVGTRRTIFSFYLFITIYLVGGFLLDQAPFLQITLTSGERSQTSWLTGINPFLALRTILFDKNYLPPELTQLPEGLRRWPIGWYWSNPAGFFIAMSFLLSLLLVLPAIIMLRRVATATQTFRAWVLQKLWLSKGDRTRKPRGVWNNPIAWREAKTKASAARATMLRWGFMLLGIAGVIVLIVMYNSSVEPSTYISRTSYSPDSRTLTIFENKTARTFSLRPGTRVMMQRNRAEPTPTTFESLTDAQYGVEYTLNPRDRKVLDTVTASPVGRKLDASVAKQFLLGAIIVEFAVILLIVTNAAASTVAREREDGTLDLLLSTPITSRYYIWGKLRGLVSYVLPLVAVPLASIVICVVGDFVQLVAGARATFDWLVFPEAVVIVPATITIVAAFAAIVGMHMSLRCRTTVVAVMSSVGIVLGICGVLGWCGYGLLGSGRMQDPGLVFSCFSPFTVLMVLIDPLRFANDLYANPDEAFGRRVMVTIFSIIAIAAYAGIVWAMYTSMVKNFDMTIRKQSR